MVRYWDIEKFMSYRGEATHVLTEADKLVRESILNKPIPLGFEMDIDGIDCICKVCDKKVKYDWCKNHNKYYH